MHVPLAFRQFQDSFVSLAVENAVPFTVWACAVRIMASSWTCGSACPVFGQHVSFGGSEYHGNVAVGFDERLKANVMTLAFCGSGRAVHDFHGQVPHRLIEIAAGVFRNYNQSQVLVVSGGGLPSLRMLMGNHNMTALDPNVQAVARGTYSHPGFKENSIQLVYIAGLAKVIWQGGNPNGHWEFQACPKQGWGAGNFDMDKPVLSLRFNARGIEEECSKPSTVYACMTGSSNVYRAVGQSVPGEGAVRLYADHEMSVMRNWHIVIVLQ